MVNQKRKVSFYLLSLEKHVYNKERNTTIIRNFNAEETEKAFQEVYGNMKTLSNKHKAIDVTTSNNTYVVEVIEYVNHKCFIRIGQQNFANTAALRDKETLESEEVPMKDSQLLELYTFCFIDFKTGIISYIGINGAPKVSAVKYLLNDYLNKENIYAKLAVILTNDILKSLLRKNIVSQMTVTVAVPCDNILSDVISSKEVFDELRNIKTSTVTYKLVGKRNSHIFNNSNNLSSIITELKSKFGDKLCALTVNAKDKNEYSQTYDLLEYNFTKTVVLNDRSYYLLTEKEFKDLLESTYETNKDELLMYTQQ